VASCRLVTVRSCLVAVVLATVVSGCGGQAHSAAPTATAVNAAFKGSPPPLAALHAQSNQLLGGGATAFKARLRALHGYPVVVNLWASWCDPCQQEFPVYQRVAVAYGRRVAFLGIDGKDADSAASAFLRHFPVTYPSYADPHGSIEAAINAISYFPQTLYFSPSGTMVFDKAGPYLNAAALEKDIRFYLHVAA
jgi:cytochrome c biogenesis protein CcmG, thiol:disulfide interchange protein DsbE